MKIIKYPVRSIWGSLQERSELDLTTLYGTVNQILKDVETEGDVALSRYGKRFDKTEVAQLKVTDEEIKASVLLLPEDLKNAIRTAKKNIEAFHLSQRLEGKKVETIPGVTCWQKAVAIEKIGLYIPGGTAPLFSTVLMLAVPAKIAGCRDIVLCTPPAPDGKVHPAILYAAEIAGVNQIFKVGGAQAIAAMAYGTATIPKVYKIFGPGNQYVTTAKQLVSLKDVAIDMPAGPSEVQIIADNTANPAFIAWDFLSQAEHGADSQSLLLTTSEALAERVSLEIDKLSDLLPRKALTVQSLSNSRIIILSNDEEIVDFTNQYAPEHLIINVENYVKLAGQIINAGSVFLGAYTPESAGDYASGTNHTLPTKGYARMYSGVNLDSFVKKITFQEITGDGLRALGPTIEVMAANEQLDAHKNAVTIRLRELNNKSL